MSAAFRLKSVHNFNVTVDVDWAGHCDEIDVHVSLKAKRFSIGFSCFSFEMLH